MLVAVGVDVPSSRLVALLGGFFHSHCIIA
jgi:hypothetical protein